MKLLKINTQKTLAIILLSGISISSFAQPIPDHEIMKNVTEIPTPLEKLTQLEPKVFEYDTEKYKHLKLQPGKQFGFMPENMQQVFPELISIKQSSYMFGKNSYRTTKIKEIDESGLIPILVASIKQQQIEIEKLQRDIAELKKEKMTSSK